MTYPPSLNGDPETERLLAEAEWVWDGALPRLLFHRALSPQETRLLESYLAQWLD